MDRIFLISGLGILISICIVIYLNYLEKEKIKIKKLIEFKNFIFAFKTNSYLKLDELLYKEKNKISSFSILKEEVEKMIFTISQDELYVFYEVWDNFVSLIIEKLNLDESKIEIKENLILYKKFINSLDDNNKNQFLNQIVDKLNINIERLENEFNKKKILNFKYLVISILLIIILNV